MSSCLSIVVRPARSEGYRWRLLSYGIQIATGTKTKNHEAMEEARQAKRAQILQDQESAKKQSRLTKSAFTLQQPHAAGRI